jgi:AraC-like DNA-binding protein
MTASTTVTLLQGAPLAEVLAQKFLPVVYRDETFPIVVARSSFKELHLPEDVTAEPRTPCGPRIVTRSTRHRERSASWPEDDLQEARVPVFVLIANGHADIRMGNYILHCPPGTVIFVPAGVPQPAGRLSHLEGASRKKGQCDILWLRLGEMGVDCWMCHSKGVKHRGTSEGEWMFLPDQLIRRYVHSFEEEVEANKLPDETILQNLVRILVVSIYRDIEGAQTESQSKRLREEPPEGMPRESTAELIEQAKQYIQSHLSDTLSLDILARKIGMSRTRFISSFRAQTGLTVNEYICNCRLERAKALLSESSWSMRSITLITGLGSTDYFRRFFFKRMQISPTKYRREMRNQAFLLPKND